MSSKMQEPVLNENGIQEFLVTKEQPFYVIDYRINDDTKRTYSLLKRYGIEQLWHEFQQQMEFLIEMYPSTIHKIEVLDVWEHFQKEVHYRKAWVGDHAPFMSYDWIRNKIAFDPWILYVDPKCKICQWNYKRTPDILGVKNQGHCYMLQNYDKQCEIGNGL